MPWWSILIIIAGIAGLVYLVMDIKENGNEEDKKYFSSNRTSLKKLLILSLIIEAILAIISIILFANNDFTGGVICLSIVIVVSMLFFLVYQSFDNCDGFAYLTKIEYDNRCAELYKGLPVFKSNVLNYFGLYWVLYCHVDYYRQIPEFMRKELDGVGTWEYCLYENGNYIGKDGSIEVLRKLQKNKK